MACAVLQGHAPPTPIPIPPLHVNANTLVDSAGMVFVLRGVAMPGLEVPTPSASDLAAQRAMTGFTFRVIQQRWNMNTVRLPVGVAVWKRDGQAYLDRVAAVAALANAERLVVVLAAVEDGGTGLPGASVVDFWKACAATFQKSPGVIFALYNEPSTAGIPGSTPGAHRAQDWQAWRGAMQPLVNAIRGMGAQQLIAAPSFHDALEFQGFGPDYYLTDANVIYETHPYFDAAQTDEARTANFGFVAGIFPVYAGAWGMPFGHAGTACTAIPPNVDRASDLLFAAVTYFNPRGISWTVGDFAVGSLLRSFDDFPATGLDKLWTCDASSDPAVGIGQFVLLWMTGDPAGFGSLQTNQITSAAGGFPGPVTAGEILTVYGQGIGPVNSVSAQYDASGKLPAALSEVQVFFDGIAAPLFVTDAYQVNAQVPWEVAGRKSTRVQLVYRGVPSNTVDLLLADAAPGIFTLLGTSAAAVLNQEGSVNDAGSAASRGSVVSFFATGLGQSTPASLTGTRAPGAGAQNASVTLKMANVPVQVLYAGPAPGLVGVTQVNARVPQDVPVSGVVDRVSVTVMVNGAESRQGVTFWVK